MPAYDVALIAFRLLALWLVASALGALAEMWASWESFATQALSAMSGTSNPITRSELFWLTSSAMLARGAVGGVLWWGAPLLAYHTSSREAGAPSNTPSRAALYSAAAFLVGVWLLSDALPGLAFIAFAATRPGTPAYDDGLSGARVAELVAKLVLGVAFLRSNWLTRWVLGASDAAVETSPEGPSGPTKD